MDTEMPPWKSLTKPQKIDIVAPDGTLRCSVLGYYSGNMFIIDDMTVDVRSGDELRRLLPNGRDDTYNVVDPKFFDGAFGPHYQVKVSRKDIFPHQRGGHLSISVSGPNSRVSINSTDNSTNTVSSNDVFADMRHAIENGVADLARRAEIQAKINDAEKAKGTPGFISAYQGLISSAADHLSLLTPFLPALSNLLG